jgi:hypothetical protein
VKLFARQSDPGGPKRRPEICCNGLVSVAQNRFWVPALWGVLAALLMFFPGGLAQAGVIHDRFDTQHFQLSIWDPCIRPESEMSIVYLPLEKFYATKLLVHHYPAPANGVALSEGTIAGIQAGDPKTRRRARLAGRDCSAQFDKSERAELWEANRTWLKFGTEVWYAFTMYVDPSVSPREQRLVIGQWKGENDKSPMIAQRFTEHRFTISVEQDNDAGRSDPRDLQCRIYVAHDDGPAGAGDEGQPRRLKAPSSARLPVDSVSHDLAEVIHDPSHLCARDIEIQHYNDLPDAFGHWTRMLYHIKATADSGGLLEIWANGAPIVSVRGRFGFRADRGTTQRFKFGPYRNRPGPTTYMR